jgi:hypothetical protein
MVHQTSSLKASWHVCSSCATRTLQGTTTLLLCIYKMVYGLSRKNPVRMSNRRYQKTLFMSSDGSISRLLLSATAGLLTQITYTKSLCGLLRHQPQTLGLLKTAWMSFFAYADGSSEKRHAQNCAPVPSLPQTSNSHKLPSLNGTKKSNTF